MNNPECKRCRTPIEQVEVDAFYGCCTHCFSYLHDLDEKTADWLPLTLKEIWEQIFNEQTEEVKNCCETNANSNNLAKPHNKKSINPNQQNLFN